MIPTLNSFTLSQHIPNAQLIIYPDSGHASLFQYPDLFPSQTERVMRATVVGTFPLERPPFDAM